MTTTPDAVLASAVDLARATVLESTTAEKVGDHVETVAEGELVVTHYFTCLDRAYRGWRWAVTVARTPGSDDVTVDEVVLLPAADALLAPEWVPWQERVRPGDLGPGDLHPTVPGDPRLEPGLSGEDALDAVDETWTDVAPLRPEQWELGLGREVVLSPYGKGAAADRWYDGDFGPESPMAKAAPGPCRSCGFLLPIGGLTGQAFGVCAHELGADGRVVALDYGCGAHSSVRPVEGTGVPVTDIAVDDDVVDVVDLTALPEPAPVVPVLDDEAEELDLLDAVVVREDADGSDGSDIPDITDMADGSDEVALVLDDAAFLDAEDEQAGLADLVAVDGVDAADAADADEAADDDGTDHGVAVLDDDLDDEDDLDDDEDDEDEDDEDDDLDEDDESEDEDDEDDDGAVADELADVDDIEPDEIL